MSRYLYSIDTIKYGTPTGTNTMPGSLVSLPDTVKGTVTIDETEGSYTDFFVDQAKDPVRTLKSEEGKLTATMQFYDFNFLALAAFKGGTAPTSGGYEKFVPATGYTDVSKALELTLSSGQVFNLFNAQCFARIIGTGSRDRMCAWELKATALMTTDLAGSWEISEAD